MSLLESIDVEAGMYRLLRMNPAVARHELRLRMRGRRAYWVLFAYAGIAAGVFLLSLWLIAWEGSQQTGPGLRQVNLGRTIITIVSHTQLALILLIVPAYSAGAITMEREKRTIEMLRATLLTPSDVVTGKLLVALGTAGALLISSLPVATWCVLLGGVAPEEVLLVYGYLFCIAVFAATLGMLVSSWMGRSLGAVVTTYGAVLTLCILPIVLISIFAATATSGSSTFGGAVLGAGWGWSLLVIGALAGAWLAFLAMCWIRRRILGRWLRRGGDLAAALAALGLLAWGLHAVGPSMAKLSSLWVFALEPFMGLYGIMDAAEFLRSTGFAGAMGLSATRADLQFVIWAICCGLALFGAALCWVLAIRVYRVRGG